MQDQGRLQGPGVNGASWSDEEFYSDVQKDELSKIICEVK